MVNIAVLGYGVVGSGIWQVLNQNRAYIEKKAGRTIAIKRVLDKRAFPGDPVEPFLTADFNDILNDPDIKIIAEVMGGVEPAYTYVKQALLAGKHICTSNKELVVAHGAELLAIAREKELNFLFEASVGGGIPIIRPMNLALTTDEIVGVAGIINGTTNYILTQMSIYNKSFEESLNEARKLGYAESDPSADVDGHDSCRKLAILLSLATGYQVDYNAILTEGITDLTPDDFDFARHFGYTIKLMVDGRITQNNAEAITAPMLVHQGHPFYTVSDVYNCVLVQAKMTENVLFIGKGAGKLPTAGAVVTDIVDASKHLDRHIPHIWSTETISILPVSGYRRKKMIRIQCTDNQKALEIIGKKESFTRKGQIAWLTDCESEKETHETVAKLSGCLSEPARVLRIYEPIEI